MEEDVVDSQSGGFLPSEKRQLPKKEEIYVVRRREYAAIERLLPLLEEGLFLLIESCEFHHSPIAMQSRLPSIPRVGQIISFSKPFD